MKQEFVISKDKNGNPFITATVFVVLTGSQIARFNEKSLRKQINAMAKDFHLEWKLENNNNVIMCACIRKSEEFSTTDIHNLEMDATDFTNKVREMEIPGEEVEQTQNNEDYEFVKDLYDHFDGDDDHTPILGAFLMTKVSIFGLMTKCGSISPDLLKEMLVCYLKVHANG